MSVSRCGTPGTHGVAADRVRSARPSWWTLFSRRQLLQVRLPDRPIQFRRLADLSDDTEDSQRGNVRHVCERDLHSRQRTTACCELELYLLGESAAMPTALCMDCVKACPHDNIGILPRSMTQDVLASRADFVAGH